MTGRRDYAVMQAASALIVLHQRHTDSNCLCGGLALGESWAHHVASVLSAAGLLTRDVGGDA